MRLSYPKIQAALESHYSAEDTFETVMTFKAMEATLNYLNQTGDSEEVFHKVGQGHLSGTRSAATSLPERQSVQGLP